MGIFNRLANLWRRDRLDAEIDEEFRVHLEMAAEDAQRAGMSEDRAHEIARRRFGNVLAIRERTAAADTWPALDEIWRDFRHAIRQHKRSPGFTIAAVVTLALGIGATTAVFTLIEQVMLRPLPVARPHELWRIGEGGGCCYERGYSQENWTFFSWEAYRHLRANTPGFAQLAALQVGQAQLVVRRIGSAEGAQPHVGQYVSGNFFQTLGISPWRGRLFTDVDDRSGAPPVAVMSFRTWADDFGADSSVIGATYGINGHPFTIVGVAPPGFYGAKLAASGMPELWLPLTTEPLVAGATSRLRNPALAWLDLIGRVRDGTDPTLLEAQLRVELQRWLASHDGDMSPREAQLRSKQTLHLTPGGTGVSLMRTQYEDGLRLLLLAAVCVLLVACANTANLLLARALKDRALSALRAALGASRMRLVRQALAHSLTLGVAGAALGIIVAYAGARLILRLAFPEGDAWLPVSASPSTPVLLFALGVSMATGILFGIVPAYMMSRTDPIDALRGAGRSVGGNQHWAQNALVVAQAAMSLVLLGMAGMLGQSLRNLHQQDLGFETQGRYLVSIDSRLSNHPPEQLNTLFGEIEARLRAIPGVRAASSALYGPMGGLYWERSVHVEGRPRDDAQDDVTAAWVRMTPGFLEIIGNRLVAGRSINAHDNATAPPVAVINQAFATKFFGRENTIGRHFGPGPGKRAGTYEVVGVVSDSRYFAGGRNSGTRPLYFVPQAQWTRFDDPELDAREVWSHYLYNIVIWAPENSQTLAADVKRALGEVAPNVVVHQILPYDQVIRLAFARENMIAGLASLFSAIGLVLAAVGLYAVTAYGVEQRTSEIGIRMALGASRESVVAMVLKGALRRVGIGLALGIPAAIVAGRLIASQLFGVTPWDGLSLSVSALLLGLAALIAAAIPARRAANLTPMKALRAD